MKVLIEVDMPDQTPTGTGHTVEQIEEAAMEHAMLIADKYNGGIGICEVGVHDDADVPIYEPA